MNTHPNEPYIKIEDLAQEYKKKKNKFCPKPQQRSQVRLTVIAGFLGLCFAVMAYASYMRMLPKDASIHSVATDLRLGVSKAIDEASEKLITKEKQNIDYVLENLVIENTGENLAVNNTSSWRADIVDRNGTVLATSLPTTNLYIRSTPFHNPQNNLNLNETIESLKAVFADFNEDYFRERMSQKGRLVPVRKHLTPAELKYIYALGIPAIELENSFRRHYPQRELFAHPVGIAGRDGNGLAGLEYSLDKEIRKSQKPIETSLDIRLQEIMATNLEQQMQKFSARSATGILTNIHTGEILSMVSLPHYDPNDNQSFQGEARRNLALQVVEPGSTLKAVNVAIALETGHIDVGDIFDARQPLKVGRFTINDFHAQKRLLSVPDILIHSSNIGSALIAERLGKDIQEQYFKNLGFLDRPQGEFSEHGRPLYPGQYNWRTTELMTISYGHGIALSPLQVVSVFGAMANGGMQYEMSLKKKTALDVTQGRRVFSEKTSLKMRALLRLVVKYGSGRKGDVEGYRIAGKTGTAEKIVKGQYSQEISRTSFAGFFPADNPQYAMILVMDEPKGLPETYGYATAGWVIAPVFGQIVQEAAPILGVKARFGTDPQYTNPNNDRSLVRYVKAMSQSQKPISFEETGTQVKFIPDINSHMAKKAE